MALVVTGQISQEVTWSRSYSDYCLSAEAETSASVTLCYAGMRDKKGQRAKREAEGGRDGRAGREEEEGRREDAVALGGPGSQAPLSAGSAP